MSKQKTPLANQEKRRYSEDSKESLVYRPAKTAALTGPLFLIAIGLGGTPEDYREMARYLASLGGTVVVPDCNEPAPGCKSKDPIIQRSDVLSYAGEDALNYYRLESVVLVGHSFGAAYQAPVILNPPGQLQAYVSINGVGYESVSLLSAYHFGIRRQFKDAVSALPGLVIDSVRQPSSVRRRLNVGRRIREVKSILDLEEGHNLPFIEKAQATGALCQAYVGPQDWIISAEETRRVAQSVLGNDNIRDLHPNAGHFAPQSHPRRTARLIFEGLGLAIPEEKVA